MAILSKGRKTDKFKSHNSLKLSFTNAIDLRPNFVICESFFGSNSPDIEVTAVTSLKWYWSDCSHFTFRFHACIEQGVPWHSGNCRVWIHSQTRTWHDKNIQSPDILALCETNLDDSIDFGKFSMRGYLPLIWKACYSYAWSCCYVKGVLRFAQELSLENSLNSYLCFRLSLLHSMPYFFFLYRSPSSSLYMVFDTISSNKYHSTSESTYLLMCLSSETSTAIIWTGQLKRGCPISSRRL